MIMLLFSPNSLHYALPAWCIYSIWLSSESIAQWDTATKDRLPSCMYCTAFWHHAIQLVRCSWASHNLCSQSLVPAVSAHSHSPFNSVRYSQVIAALNDPMATWCNMSGNIWYWSHMPVGPWVRNLATQPPSSGPWIHDFVVDHSRSNSSTSCSKELNLQFIVYIPTTIGQHGYGQIVALNGILEIHL